MATYVALLRGINVGKHKRIGMGPLRELLAEAGYDDVRTLLQSGNVVLDSSRRSPHALARDLEQRIAAAFGHQVPVVVRTAADLEAVVAGNPMPGGPPDGSRFLVAFLDAAPTAAQVAALDAVPAGEDRVWVRGREVYLWCPGGLLSSTYAGALDTSLGLATSRNWNTVIKLAALAATAG